MLGLCKQQSKTSDIGTTHASLGAAETALATPVFRPQDLSRSLKLWTVWIFLTPSLPPFSHLSGGNICITCPSPSKT